MASSHIPIFLLAAVFIASRIIFTINNYKLPLWDESVYIGMGKFIYSGGISGLWESIRPIGLPIITGIGWLTGNQLLFSEIISIFFSSALIVTTYILAYILSRDRRISLLSAFIIAISPIFFYNSNLIMTEIPSTFFSILSLIFLVIAYKKISGSSVSVYLIFSGIFAGIATLFRFQQGIIFIIILFSILYNNFFDYRTLNRSLNQEKHNQKFRDTSNKNIKIGLAKNIFKESTAVIIGFTIIMLPFILFNISIYSQDTSNIFDAALRPVILGSMHQSNVFESVIDGTIISYIYNIFYYIIMLAKNNVILLLGIPAIFIIKDKKYFALKAMSVLMLLYLTYIINKQERFLIMVIPMISIMAASIIFAIYDRIRLKNNNTEYKKKYKKIILKQVVFSVIAGIFIFSTFLNLAIDKNYYDWGYKEKPEMTSYYEYIDQNNIRGPILTTDPVFAAYTDQRLIPFYDTVNNDYSNADKMYINFWEKDYSISAVAYSDYAFPCTKDTIIRCEKFKSDIKEELMTTYSLDYDKDINGFRRYIFVKKS